MLVESAGDLEQIIDPNIALAALNATDIRGVEAASVRQLFLRPALGLAKRPDSLAEASSVCIPHAECIE